MHHFIYLNAQLPFLKCLWHYSQPKSELGAQTILGSSNTTMDRQSPSQKGVRWKNMSSADMGKGHSADEDDEV